MLSLALSAAAAPVSIVFKSTAEPMGVRFSMSNKAEQCAGMESVGGVYNADTSRKILLPFIAHMTERSNRLIKLLPSQEKMVVAGVPVQILGQSTWSNFAAETYPGKGSCGPLTLQFTPREARRYLVEFAFGGSSRTQSVNDVTEPEQRESVAEQVKLSCSAP